MVFVWVQDISIGADILSLDIVEIRDAADDVLDTMCVTDNIGELVGENGLHLTAEDGDDRTTNDGTDQTGLDGTHNPTYQSPDNDGEKTPDNTGEDGTDQTGLDQVHNPTYMYPDNDGEKTPDCTAEDGSALGANQSPDNTGVDYLEDTLDHGPNWFTNYPTAVLDEYGSGDDSAAQSNV